MSVTIIVIDFVHHPLTSVWSSTSIITFGRRHHQSSSSLVVVIGVHRHVPLSSTFAIDFEGRCRPPCCEDHQRVEVYCDELWFTGRRKIDFVVRTFLTSHVYPVGGGFYISDIGRPRCTNT